MIESQWDTWAMPNEHLDIALTAPSSDPVLMPKIFISYSWTSPGHQERVRLWAEQLLQDGIDVVLDIFDLKEGHDKYSFMERMVTDPNVTHVLVVCDKTYSEKADARRAGVGTESQIISREVYEKVVQSKFIPIVCEFSEGREPYLPTFFKSRMWIDFSSMEAVNDNWEQLVRALYGKPVYQKPQLGRAPTYITSDLAIPSSPADGKLNTFKQALLQNRKGLGVYRTDFLEACVEYADSLRIRERPDTNSLGARVLEDCGKLKKVRNQIVDWVLFESCVDASTDFVESLLRLLGELRELKSRPPEVNSWNDAWFEAHSVFVYETFLYIVAALLKAESYKALHDIFTSHYLRPKMERYGDAIFDNFGCFLGHSEALQSVLAQHGGGLYSPAAELIKRQADRQDIPFSAVMEAELLVLMMAFVITDAHWHPQTLLYMSMSQPDFPFFIRATQHKCFLKLAAITGIAEADALRGVVKVGYQRLDVNSWPGFHWQSRSFWASMNMDRLDSLK